MFIHHFIPPILFKIFLIFTEKKILIIFLLTFSVLSSSFLFYAYQIVYYPNVLVNKKDKAFFIHKNTTFKKLQKKLVEENIIHDLVSFSLLARLKKFDVSIKSGRYLLKSNMSNQQLINLLRSGKQTPTKLTFSNARILEELAKKLTRNLEIDSTEMANFLLNDTTAAYYGFNKNTFISMFIPNTYEVFWTASPKNILDKIKYEYKIFWKGNRQKKSEKINLSNIEISILASIVQGETIKMDEAPTIAGVYMNRIKKGIKLQADPTIIFAIGDFSIRRVLNRDKNYDSPYNTYLYKGLPPGPINMPSIQSIDAILNYKKHNYLYFCAKHDFSGYHIFAKTLAQHNINARKFQRALNKERIYR